MAERALLACEQIDGGYTVATSRWGGTDSALAAVCAGTLPMELPDVSWSFQRLVPDFASLAASMDVLTAELCYRVSAGGTTAFLPLWFGLPLASAVARPTVGALIAVDSVADARGLRREFCSLKGTVADSIRDGTLPVAAAPLVLLASVAGRTGRERYLTPLSGSAERLSPETGPDTT